MTTTEMSATRRDRVRGVLLGQAVGDALGAAYEFGCAALGPDGPQMLGGGLGNFAPGEWTDDTSMAWCVLDSAAEGELRGATALDRIAGRFAEWFATGPADVGIQTRTLLNRLGPQPSGRAMADEAAILHAETGRTGGNGSLMRTAAVALPHLDDPEAVAEAAAEVSALTHADRRAGQACTLWSLAIRRAVVDGCFDVRGGLEFLGAEAAGFWDARIGEAELWEPARFAPNGYVVTAFQAAWASITQTPVPAGAPARHLPAALTTVIAIGDDTDTVAAIAGALLGARWGAGAVPPEWSEMVHGYPGLTGADLMDLAERSAGAAG